MFAKPAPSQLRPKVVLLRNIAVRRLEWSLPWVGFWLRRLLGGSRFDSQAAGVAIARAPPREAVGAYAPFALILPGLKRAQLYM